MPLNPPKLCVVSHNDPHVISNKDAHNPFILLVYPWLLRARYLEKPPYEVRLISEKIWGQSSTATAMQSDCPWFRVYRGLGLRFRVSGLGQFPQQGCWIAPLPGRTCISVPIVVCFRS